MANHVLTVVKFYDIIKEEADTIVDMLTKPVDKSEQSSPSLKSEQGIDFNKIIPEPTTKEECDPIYIIDHHNPKVERPWFDSSHWHQAYWGTKWNAFDYYTTYRSVSNELIFVFTTAWSTPHPILERLTLLGFDLEIGYADEDLGDNCGHMSYSIENGWSSHSLPDPATFANKLWSTWGEFEREE